MAEQSIGMATGATASFGDGNVGTGYSSARMTAMETKTLSEGVLQTGGLLAMTGNGTNTLTIASGAAIVDGYFYENTSSAAIVITSLANATYNVVIFVNETSGSLTVSRSVAGTTVGTYSVRLAVATSAQLVGQTYLQLGTVEISGAAITASGIVQDYAMYGTTSQLPYQAYAIMDGGIAVLTSTGVEYELSSFNTPVVSGEGLIVPDPINNFMAVTRSGLYTISAFVTFSSGTTGLRRIHVNVNGIQVSSMNAGAVSSSQKMTVTSLHLLNANDVVSIGMSTTQASQTVDNGLFTVARA
jgi:hypothetical protein